MLAIEPLALALRADKVITGIWRGDVEHKVSLYADDLLIYLSQPENVIPKILDMLQMFGEISGYNINL